MTRKLEELFDLPPSVDEVDRAVTALPQQRDTLAALDATIDKIDAALPAVRGLEATDAEMDDLAMGFRSHIHTLSQSCHRQTHALCA